MRGHLHGPPTTSLGAYAERPINYQQNNTHLRQGRTGQTNNRSRTDSFTQDSAECIDRIRDRPRSPSNRRRM